MQFALPSSLTFFLLHSAFARHLYSLNYDTFSWGILVLFNFKLYLNGRENWGKFITVSLEAGESKECGAEDKKIFRKFFKVGRGQDLNGNGTV